MYDCEIELLQLRLVFNEKYIDIDRLYNLYSKYQQMVTQGFVNISCWRFQTIPLRDILRAEIIILV